MIGKQAHLSDEELLLFSDQELPTRQATRAREHVAQCEPCRKRLAALESASADLAELHEQQIQARTSGSSDSRHALQELLSQRSIPAGRVRAISFQGSMARQLASASIALLLVAGGTWAFHAFTSERSSLDLMQAQAASLPRKALTPGVTRLVAAQDLCSSADLDNDPPVTSSLEQAVFKEYGLPVSAEKEYQLDYLITPALGGSDNIRNLWPQPESSVWNSRVKDQLEDHLHELVCQGKLQLTTAQNDMATDWIAAYKRYFNTDKPEAGPPNSATADSTSGFESRRHSQRKARIMAPYNVALVISSWRPAAHESLFRHSE